jgi:hypothetical protein
MTSEQLYKVYAAWSGQLHFYVVKELGAHVDCEFFPDTWKFGVYSGYAQDAELGGFGALPVTVPGLRRPARERKEVLQLPRPEDDPSPADLDKAFVDLCLAAARVLKLDLKKAQLPAPPEPKKHALPGRKKKR